MKKDGGNVDAITAATISSRAFCTGIREAYEHYQTLKQETTKKTETNQGGQKND